MSTPGTLETSSAQNQRPLRVIGLTGGIGMGKTTISDYLANVHHIPVFDADVLAREAVQPNSPILGKLVDRYGAGILLPDGSLDRVRIGDIVFNSSAERLWVEQQIHPYVRDRLEAVLQSPEIQAEPIVVFAVPLLFEARMVDLVTEVWVVHCSKQRQIERLMQRQVNVSGRQFYLSHEQAEARINSQMAIEKKKQHADVLIENSSTVDVLLKQVDQALARPRHQLSHLS